MVLINLYFGLWLRVYPRKEKTILRDSRSRLWDCDHHCRLLGLDIDDLGASDGLLELLLHRDLDVQST